MYFNVCVVHRLLSHVQVLDKFKLSCIVITVHHDQLMKTIQSVFLIYFSKMIFLTVTGWICLLALCQGKVIEVNNKGNDSTECCAQGMCICGSVFKALLHIENNTVINITSSSVFLHNLTRIGSETLDNITITGKSITVACNNTGVFTCLYCNNVVIHGIIWDQCGDPSHPNVTHSIGFRAAINVSIIECTFQHSKVCFSIFLPLLFGFVNVYNSRFLFNHGTNSQCSDFFHGSLIISNSESEAIQNISISIIGTLFHHNGISGYVQRSPLPSATLILMLGKLQVVTFYIANSIISNTIGLGSNFFFNDVSKVIMLITNVAFYNNSNGGSKIRVSGNSSEAYLWLIDCLYKHNINGSLKLTVQVTYSFIVLSQLSIFGNQGYFLDNDLLANSNNVRQGSGIIITSMCYYSSINISFCSVEDNVGGESIVYIEDKSTTQVASIASSNFTDNFKSALRISGCTVKLEGHTRFINNSAARGAAIYLIQGAQIDIQENSSLKFIRNTALQGGAIFIELSFGCPRDNSIIAYLLNTSTVLFINNSAENTGSSIYFDNPRSCALRNNSIYFKFTYLQPLESIEHFIATSPSKINVCSSTCNNSSNTCYMHNNNMLGQTININATICDYFNHVSDVVQFYVECTNCNDTYVLSNNRILVHNGPFDVKFLAVDADRDITDEINITLNLSTVFSNKYRQLTAAISLKLSSCISGYAFDANLQQCICYEQSKDIIQCQQDYAEIKYGYWFGIVVFPERSVSLCPIYYCQYDRHKETTNGYYKLPQTLNDQCSLHRTGIACGECKPGYTLAYDSPDCVNIDKCSGGITFVVVVSTVFYWAVVVALVFGLMQLKISLGSVYGLIYYYSIIDLLLGSNLFISNGVFQLVTILSSFAKLTPQFLGKLCFLQGLSGIDQLFIHYFHAIFIFLMIVIIVVTARYSHKIASIVSRCIIRVICLLILLSYTSLASTSLQLLRPIYFDDANNAHVYLSPSIKYFTGRHIPYGIIASLCELFIVIGLPLLLLLEPFLKRKVNFIKIKPLLDQYQECYKDQYHWFAAYYLICRQVIIIIVYVNNFNNSLYYVQTACIIIVTIHVWIKPYKTDTLNVLDGILLMTMILVINLNSFTFSRNITVTLVVIMVLFPLLLLCLIYGKTFVLALKYIWNHKKGYDEHTRYDNYM